MDGILSVVNWATNTLEGVAFIEILILIAVIANWRRMAKHEEECNKRHEKDAEWKGAVDAKLEQLQKD